MKRIIYTSGCYDILHYGHIRFLEQARKLGDELVVLLNSDKSVKLNKGSKRPIHNEKVRRAQLEALKCVDLVMTFDDKDPSNTLKWCNGEDTLIFVKSSEYIEQVIPEEKLDNVQVVYIKELKNYSTTNLIKRLKKL